jgi:V8-like Glu-specific endopeptidase
LDLHAWHWRTIGRISVSACTGTLVGPDLVLTAAHCVIDTNTGKLRDDIGEFFANVIEGASRHHSGFVHVWWGTNNPDNFRGHDWAILKLAQPLGVDYGWLGVNGTSVENFPNEITVAGYSTDFLDGLTASVHHNCQVHAKYADKNLVLHDCDTARGSSGGPVLRLYNGQLTIVGLNVAEYRDGGNTSLHLPYYEDKHGNIAIPAQEIVDKIIEIQNH